MTYIYGSTNNPTTAMINYGMISAETGGLNTVMMPRPFSNSGQPGGFFMGRPLPAVIVIAIPVVASGGSGRRRDARSM